MPTFGIIAEGPTDQIVLENILCGYFGDSEEELVVNYVQPPRDVTGLAGEPAAGGWTLVFSSIRDGKHRKALQYNDFVLIQIDTDRSEDKGFDVSWLEAGSRLSLEEFVDRVVDRLKQAMDPSSGTLTGTGSSSRSPWMRPSAGSCPSSMTTTTQQRSRAA